MTDFGKIKSYDSGKGTGTIVPESGGDALPFRSSDMQQEGEVPRQDQRYGYDVEAGDGGRRHAVNLQQQAQEPNQEQAQSQEDQARNQAG